MPRQDRRVAHVGDRQEHDRESGADDEGQQAGDQDRPADQPAPAR
jgi:hypothetical protein